MDVRRVSRALDQEQGTRLWVSSVSSGITTGAAVFGSGAAFLGLILHWIGRL